MNEDIIKLNKSYNNIWPCYSNFNQWDKPLNNYMNLCDEKMSVKDFRKYMGSYFYNQKYTTYGLYLKIGHRNIQK